MTSLRAGLRPPRRALPRDELGRLRSYLDGQSRVRLAAWASHEHRTPDGVDLDDHLLLGVPDADLAGENAVALERGLEEELPGIHAWLDLFALSDLPALRRFAEVLWERPGGPAEELDPLDFRLTWEPLEPPRGAVEAFAVLVRPVAGVRRVEACCERLWKNGRELRASTQFHVAFDGRTPDDFDRIDSALRRSGIRQRESSGMTASLPRDERVRTAVLYER